MKSVNFRLIALLVVAILGVYYIAFDALGIHVINRPYTVKVNLQSGGGIYTDAAVTYRGVQVGKVSSIHLYNDHVEVDLAVNHGTKIPSDVNASVKELTAAAEQYMDLEPRTPAGPGTTPAADVGYLKSGSLIPMQYTTVPVSVGTLLNTVNSLADSLHASDLNTIATALATGLQNAGPDLRAIIDDGRTLIEALNSEVPATVSIIDNGNGVLNTFNNTGSEFNTLAAGLNRLSATVASDNSNVAALLANGAQASTGLNGILTQDTTPAIGVINGFSETAGLANQRQGAVQALFQILPVVAQDAAMTINPSTGTPRFQLQFNTANNVCPYSAMEEPTSMVPVLSLTNNCGRAAPDLLQRGAATAPTPSGGTP